MRSRANWFAGLILFWIALSGSFDLQHVLLGAGVAWVALRMRESIVPSQRPGPPQYAATAGRSSPAPLGRRIRRTAAYFLFLLVEIVKANIQVALIALNPRLPISPAFLHYRPPLRSDWGRVLMGNSITLTPGTLTVELEHGEYLVHTLTAHAAHSLPGWPAEARICELEALSGEAKDLV